MRYDVKMHTKIINNNRKNDAIILASKCNSPFVLCRIYMPIYLFENNMREYKRELTRRLCRRDEYGYLLVD